MQRAEAVAVIPDMKKAGFGIGGSYGKGLLSRRMSNGRWSAPVYVTIGGGSFGAQIGISSTELVLVFTDKGALDMIENGRRSSALTPGVVAAHRTSRKPCDRGSEEHHAYRVRKVCSRE
jgi:lipid-binding SYLF domain-containing protein